MRQRTQVSRLFSVNDELCDVDEHSKNHSHHWNGSDLCDNLNARLRQQDMRDRLNDCRAEKSHMEEVRVAGPDIINYQIEEL